jgi:hypothetical protein
MHARPSVPAGVRQHLLIPRSTALARPSFQHLWPLLAAVAATQVTADGMVDLWPLTNFGIDGGCVGWPSILVGSGWWGVMDCAIWWLQELLQISSRSGLCASLPLLLAALAAILAALSPASRFPALRW